MTAKENRPGIGTEAAQVPAGGLKQASLGDTTVIDNDCAQPLLAARNEYPHRIVLSEKAENYLDGLAMDLVLGYAHYWQLSPALTQLWEFAYQQGRASRDSEIQTHKGEADRLYFEMTLRQPKPQGEYLSWADLQKRRAAREEDAASNYPGGDLAAAWGVTE